MLRKSSHSLLPNASDWSGSAPSSGPDTRLPTLGRSHSLQTRRQSARPAHSPRSQESQTQAPPRRSAETKQVAINRPSTNSLWDKAFDTLRPEEQVNLEFENEGDIRSVPSDILKAVETKKEHCLARRWKYHRKNGDKVILRDVLEKIVAWVDKFKQIGDTIVQYDPTHAALPWAAVRFFLQAAINDSQTFGAIAESMELVSNLITLYAVQENLYLHTNSALTEQLKQALLGLYGAILKYLAKVRRYHDRSTATRMALSVVQTDATSIDAYLNGIRTEEDAVASILKPMDREQGRDVESGILSLQLRVDELALQHQRKLLDIRSKLSEPIERLAGRFENALLKITGDDAAVKIPPWISKVPFEEHHRAMVRDRLRGSGKWLLQKEEYTDWMKSSVSSIIWLHGIPGSGKSKTVSTVIDQYLAKGRQTSSTSTRKSKGIDQQPAPVAYFYCLRDAADSQRADPDEVLRSIVKQLSCSTTYSSIRDPVVFKYRARKEESNFHGSEPWPLTGQDCVDLILRLLDANPATIVIDALDECDPSRRHELLQALDTIIENSINLVKIFVSSRDDGDIVWMLKKSPNIYISADDNSGDIANFVHLELERSISQRTLLGGRVSPELNEQISSTLISRAQGMFRWVSLQMQNLCDHRRMRHEDDIREELGRLPKTLADSYAIIYEQIIYSGPFSRKVAEKALKWLLCMQQSLSTTDFLCAISINEDGMRTRLTPLDILNMCSNLVVIDEELDIFRFAHLSVREYLETRSEFTSTENHALAAENCLSVCIDSVSSRDPLSWRQIPDLSYCYYANRYWPLHYEQSHREEMGGPLKEKVAKFLFTGRAISFSFLDWISFLHWLFYLDQFSWERFYLQRLTSGNPTPMFLVCRYGILNILERILSSYSHTIDQRNMAGEAGLHVASRYGHEAIIRYLLDKGANVDTLSANGMTPLLEATMAGNEKAINLLVKSGADLEVKHASGKTALNIALDMHRIDVAKTLLDAGANSDARPPNTPTELSKASKSGNTTVVKLLIDHGANLQSITRFQDKLNSARPASRPSFGTGSGGITALHEGADHGHIGVTKLLLDHGADIKAADEFGANALHRAAENGHQDIIRQLISHGADINATQNKLATGLTALHLAADHGDVGVARLLLSHGANAECRTEFDWTPLHYATCKGHDGVVHVLLESGAKPDPKDMSGRTPLYEAIRKDFASITFLLLDFGAEPNMLDDDFELSQSSEDGIILKLLENRSNLKSDPLDPNFVHDILSLAAARGNSGLVKYLLARSSPEVVQEVYKNCSLLISGARDGHASLVDLMLDERYLKRASLWQEVRDGPVNILWAIGTVLRIAAKFGHAVVVESVLKRWGVDPNLDLNLSIVTFWRGTNDNDFLSALERRGGLTETDSRLPPLYLATIAQRNEVVSILLNNTLVDANQQTAAKRRTPLHIAARYGYENTMRAFLELKGPNWVKLDLFDANGFIPLHLAQYYRHKEVVRLFVYHKASLADIRMPSEPFKGYTALLLAIYLGDFDTTKLLVSKTVDIDRMVIDNAGNTPLHIAAERGWPDLVREILSWKDVDIDALNYNGKRAWEVAIAVGQKECALLIKGRSLASAETGSARQGESFVM